MTDSEIIASARPSEHYGYGPYGVERWFVGGRTDDPRYEVACVVGRGRVSCLTFPGTRAPYAKISSVQICQAIAERWNRDKIGVWLR